MQRTTKTKASQAGGTTCQSATALGLAGAFVLCVAAGSALAADGYTMKEHPLRGYFRSTAAAAEPRAGDDAASASTEARKVASVQDIINSDARFSVFARALKETDIWNRLENQQHVTLFVPTDRALKAEGSAFLLEEVLRTESNRQRLRDVMSYHVYIGEQLNPEELGVVEMVSDNGACFRVARVGSGIRVGPEAVVTEVIPADEPKLFVVDRLLWRPWDGATRCSEWAKAQVRR